MDAEPRPTRAQHPVIIVTGASSGIGRATALRLGVPGTTIVLAARRGDQMQATRQEIRRRGGDALVVPTDVNAPMRQPDWWTAH